MGNGIHSTILRALVISIFSYLIIPFNISRADNHHDHFSSLFPMESFATIRDEIPKILKQIPIEKLLEYGEPLENQHIWLDKYLGVKESDQLKLLAPDNKGTLKDLYDLLDKRPRTATQKDPLQTLLTIDEGKIKEITTYEKKCLYLMIETIRNMLFQRMIPKPELMEKVIIQYFKTEPISNRRTLNLTLPRWLYTINGGINVLEKMKELAKLNGTNLKYYYSIPRSTLGRSNLISDGFPQSDLIDGFDITGSVQEIHQEYGQYRDHLVKSYARNMMQIFQHCALEGIPLRIHAFEGSNKGNFYAALEQVLTNFKNRYGEDPIHIEIGHINHFNEYWTDLIIKNPYIHTEANLNMASNEMLHQAEINHLLETKSRLEKKGIKVVPGFDGRGILPDSFIRKQNEILSKTEMHIPIMNNLAVCVSKVMKMLTLTAR